MKLQNLLAAARRNSSSDTEDPLSTLREKMAVTDSAFLDWLDASDKVAAEREYHRAHRELIGFIRSLRGYI